jgi:WhiB family redox-sensing transcriptional regulator
MTRRATTTASPLRPPGRWAERALCAQADPDTWYPGNHAQAAAAKRICAACPVRAQCLQYALSGADTWRGDHHRHLGRHHAPRAFPAAAGTKGNSSMTSAPKTRRRERARAARQALRLYEAESISLAWDDAGLAQRISRSRSRQLRTSTARAALLAVGLPPPVAAVLRRRLQLLPDQEDQP